MKFFETSAKEGTNVAEAFNTLARDVVGKMLATGAGEGAAAGGAAGGGAAAGDGKKGGDKKDCAIM